MKPVRIVHGFAPGSAIDVSIRPLAAQLSEQFAQTFSVEPRPGATGQLANELVSKSTPDGYVLLAAPGTSLTSAPQLQKAPYDPLKDFAPVAMITAFSYLLVAHPAVPAKSARELVALARAKPGYLTFGSTGIGSGFHLAGELFASLAGVKLVHVPYRGGGSAAMPDLVSGRVDLMWDSYGTVRTQVLAGKLRAIGVTGATRIAALADVPTIAESGLPGYDLVGWHGVLAPGGASREVVERLNTTINRTLDRADLRALWTQQGFETPQLTPEQFDQRIRRDFELYGKLIKTIGLRAQ
ncbi:MAG: tripartite tricarboxylate transporter substrate binding protein [Proteobacteria bacterium]|nr:tripartite tricarboxylate transporter substrate binding protein [Burkholderiales bacterium]